ncbi:BMP family protein [Frankia sp. CNm7]|uniref:BMP family protein n=1 Tax=Frankia nepalensis TaxID=1836974 RepID=A0A937RAD6_9ACTN|nr:BMP family protein [Frankia nepalensis]MBL7499007.1 BMP family protein [Frankia nepalensis]MBL7515821.1 BMP family protein [Frankia nepalensis]MBL7521406.1 BMP family protein [Frankia nepalensis]MBL7626067.1 BMP family protein [Frankia nepalensis]
MPRSLRGLLAAILLPVAMIAMAACGSSDEDGSAPAASGDAAPLNVALLTSGLTNDGGFNQWAAQALQKLESEGRITLQVRQQLSDPNAAEPVLRQFASRDFDLIIGHGIDLSASVLKVAAQFPDVHFATTGDNTLEQKLLPNVEGWTYDFGQFGYVGGVVAGSVKDVTKVGIVSGPDIPFVQTALKGFLEGLKATNPSATTESVFTGEFYSAQKEQEAVRGLVAGGAQLVFANTAEGNGVAPAAQQAGVPTVGTAVAGSAAAKEVNITSANLNFTPVYTGYLDRLAAGTFGKRFEVGTLANKEIGIDPVNAAAAPGVPADLQAKVDELSAQLASGELKLPDFS